MMAWHALMAGMWAVLGISRLVMLWPLANAGFGTGRFDQFDVIIIGAAFFLAVLWNIERAIKCAKEDWP